MSRENTPARRLVLKGALGVGTAAALGTATPAHARSGRPAPGRRDDKAAALSVDPPYVNPLVRQRADPHIVRHTDGSYYFTATVPEYDRIVLRRAATLNGLADAGESVIWRRHDSGEMAAHIWAPEIHFIDGAWYVYFAAGRSDDVWAIRMYVLENTSADPFTGTWTERGRITTAWDSFSLDATTFVHGGTRYLAWAQRDPSQNNNSDLYLSAMDSPWAVTGPQVRLSRPELPWETVGFAVNEGPSVLQRNGRVFLSYSASATDANYCMGLLTARDSAELLDRPPGPRAPSRSSPATTAPASTVRATTPSPSARTGPPMCSCTTRGSTRRSRATRSTTPTGTPASSPSAGRRTAPRTSGRRSPTRAFHARFPRAEPPTHTPKPRAHSP